ncbi:MAG: hypothetical protein AB1762_14645, partial [Gemmatimonadota bacterium]
MKRMIRRSVARAAICTYASILYLTNASLLGAQESSVLSHSLWRWRWSPLAPIGALGLPASTAAAWPRLLDLPAPAIGLAWSARNPAALADDIHHEYTQVAISARHVHGDYRVPTNPTSASLSVAELGGWRRVTTGSAVVGRVAVERRHQDAGNGAVLIAADPSSPFIPADTNAPPTSSTRVTLEGAQGVQLGRWRLGMALGYEGTSDN